MLNELSVLKQIRGGDIRAFESVFRMYYQPLCLYAAGITGRTDIAEEIVQELFYVCWKERERLPMLFSLKSYLYKSVRNRSLQYLEHRAVCRRHEAGGQTRQEDTPPTPEEQLEYKELCDRVEAIIGNLPQRQARIFRMHRSEGLKYTEIAAALGLSVKTVEAEMGKALQTLRKEIEHFIRIA